MIMSGVESLVSKAFKAKNGIISAIAGTAASLGVALGTELDSADRTGFYAGIGGPTPKIGVVVDGVERASLASNAFFCALSDGSVFSFSQSQGLRYVPNAVGQNFVISRGGHAITSNTSNNSPSFTFSRFDGSLSVGYNSSQGAGFVNSSNRFRIQLGNNIVGLFEGENPSTGHFVVNYSQESTSPTTGAFVVDGGVGISKDVHIGSNLYWNNGYTRLGDGGIRFSGSFTFRFGNAVRWTIGHTSGSMRNLSTGFDYQSTVKRVRVQSTQESTDFETGAFVVSGGAAFGNTTYHQGGVVLAPLQPVFFGLPEVDGTWRMIRDGDDLLIQRRESETWATKHTFVA